MYISPKIRQIISDFDFNPWINRPLTKKDKDLLCEELNIPDLYVYNHCTCPTLKIYLIKFDFTVKDTKILIHGKQKRVSILKKSSFNTTPNRTHSNFY